MSDVQDGLNVGRNGPNWIYRDTLYVAHRDIRLDCHVHHEDVVRHEYRRRWTGDGSLAGDLRPLCHTRSIITNLPVLFCDAEFLANMFYSFCVLLLLHVLCYLTNAYTRAHAKRVNNQICGQTHNFRFQVVRENSLLESNLNLKISRDCEINLEIIFTLKLQIYFRKMS